MTRFKWIQLQFDCKKRIIYEFYRVLVPSAAAMGNGPSTFEPANFDPEEIRRLGKRWVGCRGVMSASYEFRLHFIPVKYEFHDYPSATAETKTNLLLGDWQIFC